MQLSGYKPKVYLTGGDGVGWALDEDLRLTTQALERDVEFTSLEEAEIVHSVWWFGLRRFPSEQLSGKRIICHMQNDLFQHEFPDPRFRRIRSMIGLWVARGTYDAQNLASVKMNNTVIPYTIDLNSFHPLAADDGQLQVLRQKWKIPTDKYLLGSFQRDTEGSDLASPKLHKGPDVFLEIVTKLAECGHPIHILLAGPRRFWLRKHLQERGIAYTFIGEIVDTDDIAINTLPRKQLNLLYNLVDLYIVGSRYEGGPQSVLEAAASRCKIISTPVGLAEDVIEPACIFETPSKAVELIEADIKKNTLASTVDNQHQRVITHYTPQAVQSAYHKIYADLDSIPKAQSTSFIKPQRNRWLDNRYSRRLARSLRIPTMTVGFWDKSLKSSYDHRNQFLITLHKALNERCVRIQENQFSSSVSTHLLNSAPLDSKRFMEFCQRHKVSIVHRIAGALPSHQEKNDGKDDFIYEINHRYAFTTVFPSKWLYQRAVEVGYEPVNPIIIHDAVDPQIFHPYGRKSFDPTRKIRLIATDWADNPHKEDSIYEWIDEHLDWSRFEFTLVGSSCGQFNQIRQVSSLPPMELSRTIRAHDIYIAAEQNAWCPTAVIAPLACGLPILYLNRGDHSELVALGGLPFNHVGEMLSQLDILVEDYAVYQNLIRIQNIDQVADKYLVLFQEAINHL